MWLALPGRVWLIGSLVYTVYSLVYTPYTRSFANEVLVDLENHRFSCGWRKVVDSRISVERLMMELR